MTYRQLYEDAKNKLDHGMITVGEYEKMIEPLDKEIDPEHTQPEREGWIHINDIYRLISGHSNYHGDDILAALTCLAEGKEVSKAIAALDTKPENLKQPIIWGKDEV